MPGFATIALVGLAAVAAPGVGALAKSGTRPNVVVVMVDDLGYGDLSCYGAKDLSTPNIDRLFSQGVWFEEFYANCCVCSPTRAAFITGRYPAMVGVPGVIRTRDSENWGYLNPDAVSQTTCFQAAGYRTSLVGKWHLGLRPENHPNRRGFDEFRGFLGDMMDDYWTHRRHGINYMREDWKEIDPEGHATDLFTQWSIEILEAAASHAEPFFHFVSYNAPHAPIQPPADWSRRHRDRMPEVSEERAKIAALIEHLDHGVGQVLDTIDRLGLEEETIVVFTSDNGGSLRYGSSNGLLRGGKTQMYEGGLKVPTCLRWPDRIAPRSSKRRALTMDLLPTLADLCEVAIKGDVDGVSFKKELLEGAQDSLEREDIHIWLEGGVKMAIRVGDWKLVRERQDAPIELYNIATDPDESNDLSGEQRERVDQMRRALNKRQRMADRVPWRRPGQETDSASTN